LSITPFSNVALYILLAQRGTENVEEGKRWSRGVGWLIGERSWFKEIEGEGKAVARTRKSLLLPRPPPSLQSDAG